MDGHLIELEEILGNFGRSKYPSPLTDLTITIFATLFVMGFGLFIWFMLIPISKLLAVLSLLLIVLVGFIGSMMIGGFLYDKRKAKALKTKQSDKIKT